MWFNIQSDSFFLLLGVDHDPLTVGVVAMNVLVVIRVVRLQLEVAQRSHKFGIIMNVVVANDEGRSIDWPWSTTFVVV